MLAVIPNVYQNFQKEIYVRGTVLGVGGKLVTFWSGNRGKTHIVWRNFSILSPKLVLAYAEDILSDSRLKNCAKCKGG